jgi:hypothetical protein
MPDAFAKVGPTVPLRANYGMSAEAVALACRIGKARLEAMIEEATGDPPQPGRCRPAPSGSRFQGVGFVVGNPSRRAAARRRSSNDTNSRVDGRASAT